MSTAPRPEPDAAIQTHGLTRRFGPLTAVDQLDLRVAQGRIFGLLGSNGAGKTTLIKMLTTLLPPDAGEAVVAGASILAAPAAVRERIGYVPQMLSADGMLTGRENLLFAARLYGIPAGERRRRIDEALATMGLAEAADRLVETYSGGMIRRLEISQAVLHRPAVLFLDEPTIGLDPLARHAVWALLGELRRALAMTVLITTHDMEEAEALCDELALMRAGRIVVQGRPDALRASVGPEATLDDVFAHYCGGTIVPGGSFAETRAARRTAQRLG